MAYSDYQYSDGRKELLLRPISRLSSVRHDPNFPLLDQQSECGLRWGTFKNIDTERQYLVDAYFSKAVAEIATIAFILFFFIGLLCWDETATTAGKKKSVGASSCCVFLYRSRCCFVTRGVVCSRRVLFLLIPINNITH